MERVLVTGGTGFVGGEIVRSLLSSTDARLWVLYRAPERVPPEWWREPRIRLLAGDLADPSVISRPAREEVVACCDRVVHCAALVRLRSMGGSELRAANVDGTRNILRLAARLRDLRCVDHISTAYVCGNLGYPETAYEAPVDDRVQARNDYEESKRRAERLVIGSGLPWSIFRPSIVVGSGDGARYDHKTIYACFAALVAAKLLRLQRQGLAPDEARRKLLSPEIQPSAIPGVETCLKNVVLLDDVGRLFARIGASAARTGRIFHLCSPEPCTVADMFFAGAGVLETSGQYFVPREQAVSSRVGREDRFIHRALREYGDYLHSSDPRFDMANTREFAGDSLVDSLPLVDRGCLARLYRSYLAGEGLLRARSA